MSSLSNPMTKIALMVLSLLLLSCQQPAKLQPGDLLFHVVDAPNAITAVTPGMIDHVAIVVAPDSVIEAIPRQGVHVTLVDSLRCQDGYYLQARIEGIDAARSIARARQYLGLPYDSLYLPDNAAIYCSELVQFASVDKQGQPLFQPVPMSFHDSSGKVTPYWIEFYGQHDMEVPEGAPGTNPGELSQRPIVHILGKLE